MFKLETKKPCHFRYCQQITTEILFIDKLSNHLTTINT